MAGMETPEKRRWYYPTPGWLVLASLAMTGLLFLSERWRWFPFNEHKGWTVLIAVAGVRVVLLAMLLWWRVALVFRWRFQFGIRTLLVLTVAVALPFSWLAVEMKKVREQRKAISAIEKLGGTAYFMYEVYDAKSGWLARPSTPEWLRRLLGNEFFDNVYGVTIASNVFADAAMQEIGVLNGLQQLSFWSSNLTDVGMERVTKLVELKDLNLDNTQITDRGLKHLEDLVQLEKLSLCDTKVTDSGLVHLKSLIHLHYLDVIATGVTSGGFLKLHQALPNCKIVR